MVQSQSVERFDTAVVSLMNADEARACIARINSHMNSARVELLRLYQGRGWEKLGYASWRECVSAEFGESQRTLYRQLEAAQVEQNIRPFLSDLTKTPVPETQLRPLAQLTPMEQPIAWQEAQARSNGKPTARVVEEVVREMRDDKPTIAEIAMDIDDVLDPPMEPAQVADLPASRINAGLFTSATPEWYTPAHIIERVVKVFHGQIDLDPCSNSADPARANVPALWHFTQQTDGLSRSWDVETYTRVYMNPPYGDEIAAWVDRLTQAYEGEEIGEAIALLPARTDTNWFQPLKDHVLCFVKGRLRFSGSENSAPFPSVVVYMGTDAARFVEVFSQIGFCMRTA